MTTSKSAVPHNRHRRLGDIDLIDVASSPHTIQHPGITAEEPRWRLSLQLEGQCVLTQGARTCELYPGELALYSEQRPFTLDFPCTQRSFIMGFPGSHLRIGADQIARVSAVAFGEWGLGKVVVPLFRHLAASMDELHVTRGVSLIRSSLDVLVTAMDDLLHRPGAQTETSTVVPPVLRDALDYIDSQLDNPELSPRTVARALYVSVRSLHARFSEQDLSVASYIRRRRLAAIHSDLADPRLQDETVKTISARYGLLDSTYVSRAFRLEYGESPSAYRSRILP